MSPEKENETEYKHPGQSCVDDDAAPGAKDDSHITTETGEFRKRIGGEIGKENSLSFLNLSWWLILAVRGYQLIISPFLGDCCRFTPSCSQYYIEAIHKYGPLKGTLKGIWRILRCNPWNKGGYDPP